MCMYLLEISIQVSFTYQTDKTHTSIICAVWTNRHVTVSASERSLGSDEDANLAIIQICDLLLKITK